MFSLYHSKLERTLGLSAAESGDIQSFGTLGGLCLAFVPGIVYDRYGFVVCLVSGGVLASTGALLWYLLLIDGGAPGNPGWHSLAGAFLILGVGTRSIFMAGVCAVLDAFPVDLAPRLSSIMSLFSAVGALIFPCVWKAYYLEREALPVPESHPDHPHLQNVAHFHLMLVLVYGMTTVAGAFMGPMVPRRNFSAEEPSSARPSGAAVFTRPPFICLAAICLMTLPVVYEYLGSAMAPLGKKSLTAAGVTTHDVQQTQASMTTKVAMVALTSRAVFGLAADSLTRRAEFQSSALYLLFFATNLLSLVGFLVILGGYVGPVISVNVWECGTFFLSTAFAGFFSLLGGAVRTWFPRHEIGTWLGLFLGAVGVCNFLYARVAAFTDFGVTFWQIAAAVSAVTAVTCGQFAYTHFLKDAERILTTPRGTEVAGDTAA